MSKLSWRRPRAISDDEMAHNWDLAFGHVACRMDASSFRKGLEKAHKELQRALDNRTSDYICLKCATELKTVLDSHAQWLEGKPGGKQAHMHGANLQEADLHGADLYRADLHGANLQDANLQGADLQGANLQGAHLHGANLRGADLYGANLQEANLHGANLQGASLQWAYLHGADLYGANLQGATRYSNAPLGWKVVDNHLEHA